MSCLQLRRRIFSSAVTTAIHVAYNVREPAGGTYGFSAAPALMRTTPAPHGHETAALPVLTRSQTEAASTAPSCSSWSAPALAVRAVTRQALTAARNEAM